MNPHGLPKPILAWLHQHARLAHTFPKGSPIIQQQNAWECGSFKTRASHHPWCLWVPKTLQNTPILPLSLDKHGLPPNRHIPYEQIHYGPLAKHLQTDAVHAASDGSVKTNGKMGAAATAKDKAFPDQQAGLTGPPNSTNAEILGITLAVTASPSSRPS